MPVLLDWVVIRVLADIIVGLETALSVIVASNVFTCGHEAFFPQIHEAPRVPVCAVFTEALSYELDHFQVGLITVIRLRVDTAH